MEGKCRCCQDCNASCSRDLRKVADLKKPGVFIYVNNRKDSLKWSTNKSDDAYILQNTSCNELKKTQYIGELRHYQTNCFQCKRVVQRVRSLLDELTEIRKNQILGICEHCKRSKSTKKCPRCDYILKKFLSDKVRQSDERQRRFKVWLCRVRYLLQAILDGGNVCQYGVYQEPESNLELKNLLQLLKAPLSVHEPTCDFFPIEKDLASLQKMTESTEIIDELILKLQSDPPGQNSFDNSSFPSKMCICKYYKDKDFGGELPELDFCYKIGKDGERDKIGSVGQTLKGKMSTVEEQKERESGRTGSTAYKLKGNISMGGKKKDDQRSKVGSASYKIKGNTSIDIKISKEEKSQSASEKAPRSLSKKTDKEQRATSDKELGISSKSLKELELSKKEPEKRHRPTSKKKKPGEEEMYLKLLQGFKMQKHDKQVGTPHAHKNEKLAIGITGWPPIKLKDHKSLKSLVTESESYMECGDHLKEPPEMIKRTEIVPYDPHYKDEKRSSRIPLLFSMYSPDFACPVPEPPSPSATSVSDMSSGQRARANVSATLLSSKGALSYRLSNRKFIDSGVTKLPSEKIMRKMNIYKMKPAYPNWFERNKSMTKYYNTGEILAEINEDGFGKWFYKNGVVALDYHCTEERSSSQRYVVYSSGKDFENICRYKPQTVLGSFDFQGYGVVYDHNGNIRLKYNQSEGLIADEKIAPPGKWKWHTLNDPPVLQRLYVNTNLKPRDPMLELLDEMKHKEDKEMAIHRQQQEASMLTIELNNYVKEKADKILREFKPLQIRMKAIKLNEQFSLKILDQANIRLYFRDGATSLKLNIGMSLISDEIIDTDTAEISEVATPYDKRPPKTNSVANIQRIVDRARNKGTRLHGAIW